MGLVVPCSTEAMLAPLAAAGAGTTGEAAKGIFAGLLTAMLASTGKGAAPGLGLTISAIATAARTATVMPGAPSAIAEEGEDPGAEPAVVSVALLAAMPVAAAPATGAKAPAASEGAAVATAAAAVPLTIASPTLTIAGAIDGEPGADRASTSGADATAPTPAAPGETPSVTAAPTGAGTAAADAGLTDAVPADAGLTYPAPVAAAAPAATPLVDEAGEAAPAGTEASLPEPGAPAAAPAVLAGSNEATGDSSMETATASTRPSEEPAPSPRAGERQDASAPPGDPPDEAPVLRVVRTDGNANTENRPAGQEKKDDTVAPARPLPHASAQGIAHANANSAVAQLRTAGETPAAGGPQAPAGPAAPAPIPDQVAGAVIERVDAGGGEATIRLDPPDLGEVTIQVTIDRDQVRLDIRAERPEAMQLLKEHTFDLSSLLGSRGLGLADVFVGLDRGRQQEAPEHTPNNRPREGSGEFAELLGISESGATRLHNRLQGAYNPDGAHLYRV